MYFVQISLYETQQFSPYAILQELQREFKATRATAKCAATHSSVGGSAMQMHDRQLTGVSQAIECSTLRLRLPPVAALEGHPRQSSSQEPDHSQSLAAAAHMLASAAPHGIYLK